MIISHKYKYIFIATPVTASTSIQNELLKYYDGEPILNKHSNYLDFERTASEAEKEYFVFAGVRNPLDEVVSRYFKYLSNHNLIYTDERNLLKNGGFVTYKDIQKFKFVQDKNKTFKDFLINFYRYPFTSNMCINKNNCDYIIRYENIQENFSQVLKLLNITQVKPLPITNITKGKRTYLDYFEEDIIDHALEIFSPYMLEYGYEFPKSWSKKKVSYINQKKYEILKKLRYYYLKYIARAYIFLRGLDGQGSYEGW